MDKLESVFIVTVDAKLTFPVEASSAEAALKTWQSWQRRYSGRIPTAGAGTAVLDVATAAVAPERELAAAHGDER
jgi:hypothetical protein